MSMSVIILLSNARSSGKNSMNAGTPSPLAIFSIVSLFSTYSFGSASIFVIRRGDTSDVNAMSEILSLR